MSVCPQTEESSTGRAFGGGQLRIRRVARVVPGQAPADELKVDVGVADEDDGDETTVAVDVAPHEVDDRVEHERRGQPLGGPAEGLPKLRAVDAVEADADALAVAKDGEGVAVVDADDESVEGVGWVGVGGRKSDREGRRGDDAGRK
jgi:hypothetical protein